LIGTIADLGLAAALIQLKQDRISEVHYDTAFWLSLFFNSAVFLIFAIAIGPLAAGFYAQPLLRSVVPALGLVEWIRSLGIVPRISLTRGLRFKTLTLVETSASIAGGVSAVALAVSGGGVWSMVAQGLIAAVIQLPALWHLTGWRPKMRFSRQALSDVVGFSVFDVLQRTVNYLTNNADYLLVGKLLGAEPLGVYSLAFMMTDTFRQQIMAVSNRVMFPVYGRLQDDAAAIRGYYLKAIRYNSILVAAAMLVLVGFARPLISVVLGPGWALAAFPIQAMAIASTIHAIGGTSESVLRGLGRARLNFQLSLAKTVAVTLPAFALLIYYQGINGAAMAVVIHKSVSRVMYQYYMRKLIGVTERDVFGAIRPMLVGLLAAGPVLAALHLMVDLARPVSLALGIVLVVCAYSAAVYSTQRHELLQMARRLLQGMVHPEEAGGGRFE
jgi:O-antigen/teichoic acid export membrane protein